MITGPSLDALRRIGSVSLVLAVAACYQPPKPADEQPIGRLDLPAMPMSFDLFGAAPPANGETVFRGSIMLFRNDAPPELLIDLVQAGKETRRAKADWKDLVRTTITPLEVEQRELLVAYQRVESEAHGNAAVAQRAAARAWLEHRVEGLGPLYLTQAKAVIEAYCEAKIWELGVSSKLATEKFFERPSPFIGCEDIYASKGHFANDARCAPSDVGANYFACLWHAGVMRTRYFVGRYDMPFDASRNEQKSLKIAQWVEDGTLQSVVASDRGPPLVTAALSQAKLRVSRILGAAYKDTFVPKTGTPVMSPDLPLGSASPQMLIAAIEDGPLDLADSPPSLKLGPPAGDPNLIAFHRDVRLLAIRSAGESSASDHLFNHPVSALPEPPGLAPLRTDPAFQFIFAAIAPEHKQKLNELAAARQSVSDELGVRRARAEEAFQAYTKTLKDGAIAATKPGVTDALWINAVLRLEALPSPNDHLLRLTFTLDDATIPYVAACVLRSSHSQSPCPEGEYGVTIDLFPGEGKLRFSYTAREADATRLALSLASPQGDGEPFMALETAELLGKRLELEIFPNRLGEAFDFLSGKIYVRQRLANPDEQGEILHEGAFNLLED